MKPVCLALLLATAPLPGAADTPVGVVVAARSLEPRGFDVGLPAKVGRLAAGEQRVLAFQVSGRLERRAEPGDAVAAGQPIAALDRELQTLQLRQTEASLAEAVSELRRAHGLRERNAISNKALEHAETSVVLRQGERDAAAEELARRALVAPFDGIVAEARVETAEVVRPGEPVVVFMDLAELQLVVGVPGRQVSLVEPGQRVVVTVGAFPDARFEGRVRRVAPATAEGGHLFEVEIRVPNAEGQLRPGMEARARIVTRTLPSALVVPIDVVVERGGRRQVFFVDGDVARAVAVDDAPTEGDWLALTADVPYRQLIVRGQRDLVDGASVRVDNTVLSGLEARKRLP